MAETRTRPSDPDVALVGFDALSERLGALRATIGSAPAVEAPHARVPRSRRSAPAVDLVPDDVLVETLDVESDAALAEPSGEDLASPIGTSVPSVPSVAVPAERTEPIGQPPITLRVPRMGSDLVGLAIAWAALIGVVVGLSR